MFYFVSFQNKVGILVKMLKSIGILKKKKKDENPEGFFESDSTLEVDMKPKHTHAPFRQNITNYVMHGQEYYHRPPVPQYVRPEYGQTPYDPRAYYNPLTSEASEFTPHRVHQQTILEHASSGHYQQPSAPPYPGPYEPHYGHMHSPYAPQPPLCLKEVEVKSTSTQSEKKFSFFNKRPRKKPRPSTAHASVFRGEPDPRNCSTQTAPFLRHSYPLTHELQKKEKPGFFSAFKNLQKGDYDEVGENPTTYGYKTHKRLAEGDINMRNALLNKLFFRKNPFSPRNLMVRTLLGKDKSKYAAPVMKTRMFF